MWEEPRDGRPRSFRGAFVASGIDIERLMARAQQDDVKKRLIDLRPTRSTAAHSAHHLLRRQ